IPDPGGRPRPGRSRRDSAGTLFQPQTMVDPDSDAFRARQPSDGFLLLRQGEREERIPLEGAGTVFGGGEADVRLSDPAVAARHFRVDVQGNDFFLRDLDSGCGTLLNGREIRHVELRSGDEIRVGDLVLVFVTEPRAASGGG
ncbi:MAG TPA: FHA domain-containing protein, partial [Thermoanaerobaculia bacterium]|nr:FHA domain-containing protein [Thermoanaerobaculia bacterium]